MLLVFAIVGVQSARAGEDADFKKAHGLYTLQEYSLAAEAFTKYLSEFTQAERADQARLFLGESYYQLKQYPQSAAAFDKFIADYPQSPRRPDALLRGVKVHFLIKEYEKSLKTAELFLAENQGKLSKPDASPSLPPQVATALYYAGESAYALKNSDQAKLYWGSLMKTQPTSKLTVDASEGLGWIHFDAKAYDQALSCFQITAAAPNHPRAAWGKLMEGRSLAALKKTDDALAAFKAAPALSGGGKDVEAEAALRSAEVLLEAGRFPAASEAFKQLTILSPEAPSTAQALAIAALSSMDNKRFEDTIAFADMYLSTVKTNPDRATMLRLKARALSTLKKPADALAAARQAAAESADIADTTRKNEEHPASILLLAELSGDGAAEQYSEVIKLYPETRFGLAAQYELARIWGQAGKVDEAYTQIKNLVERLAKQPADQKNLNELRRDALFAAGEFAFRKPEYANAELFLKAYRDLAGPADVRADDVARKLAWCRHEANDIPGTAAILDSALEAYPKSQYRDEMIYLRALCAASVGQNDAALKFNESLLKEFPASSFSSQALYDSAAMLYKAGKLDDAIGMLTTLLAKPEDAVKAPLRSAAYQLRATLRLQTGKAADALTDAQAILKAPASEKASDKDKEELKARRRAAGLLQALALIAQGGKDADAEAALNALITEGPASAPEIQQAILRRAHLRFDAKKFAQAKDDLKLLTAKLEAPLSPETLEAALYLALCHKELKENAEAKAVLEKLDGQKLPGVAAFEVPFQLGNLAFEAADNTAAAASYQKALAAAPGIKDLPAENRNAAQLNLAWSYRRGAKLEEAEKAFGELLKLDTAGTYTAEALYERGRVLSELGKLDEAQQCFKEIVERKPDSPQAEKGYFLVAQALVKAARFKDAAASFENYIAKFPQAPSVREAYCGLAECRVQNGSPETAREAFLKVLGGKSPEDAEVDEVAERALLGLAEISLKAGDGLAAKKLALRILTERPNSTWRDAAYLAAGQSSEALKEPEKAIGYYRKLLSEKPTSPHAPAASERLKALGAPAKE